MTEHPLAINQSEVLKEFNFSKFAGQVALSVTVALAARFLLQKWDKFTAKKSN